MPCNAGGVDVLSKVLQTPLYQIPVPVPLCAWEWNRSQRSAALFHAMLQVGACYGTALTLHAPCRKGSGTAQRCRCCIGRYTTALYCCVPDWLTGCQWRLAAVGAHINCRTQQAAALGIACCSPQASVTCANTAAGGNHSKPRLPRFTQARPHNAVGRYCTATWHRHKSWRRRRWDHFSCLW